MNVEFINEGNKLCAEYLGYKYYKWSDKDIPNNLSGGWIHTKKQPKDRYYYLGRTAKEMAFHWDWNLLMLVVEKIESTRDEDFGWFQVYINVNQCDIRSKYAYLSDNNVKSYTSDPNAIFETKVQSTFYNVVNFLKFLKNNEKLREANQ